MRVRIGIGSSSAMRRSSSMPQSNATLWNHPVDETFPEKIRHHFNPLHVYCRLVDLRMNRKLARALVTRYEHFYHLIF